MAGAMFFHVSSSTASFSPSQSLVCVCACRGQSALRCLAQCELEKELILYPRHFGPDLVTFLTEKLIQKVGRHPQDAPGPRFNASHQTRAMVPRAGGGQLLGPSRVYYHSDRGPFRG